MIDPGKPDYQNTPASPQRPKHTYSPASFTADPYVSVVTPFYNTGPVFHETAYSVLNQSFQQFEWIIVNDGSKNLESMDILNEYRNRDPRIRVINHDVNRGLSAARNTGFRMARSSYIVQIDDDDMLEPTAVEKWFWFLETHPEYSFVKGYSVQFGDHEFLWNRGFSETVWFLKANMVNPTSAVRKDVHQAVGGYDENDRGGLSDWDFWLRCASFGYWGSTIPEYLDWYRRRRTHSDRWPDFDMGARQHAYRRNLREKYPSLWKGSFPIIQNHPHMPSDPVLDEIPCDNILDKEKTRVLMIVPWMAWGGADKFNLDLSLQLKKQGWEVSIATTLSGADAWLPQFARYTPDIFILDHFLRLVDYPRFLRYLIQSRNVDVVLVSHSELAYQLLPYLRAHFPGVAFVDFCHIAETWKNGGYPGMAVGNQELLDLNIVSSKYLKHWMMQRGAESDRIHVCYTNVDSESWRPDVDLRALIRVELSIDEHIPTILYGARICSQKQPRVFAHTMLRLRQAGLSFVGLVAGDGPDADWLRAFVRKHKLENVKLLGAVSTDRMQQLMAASDVFFLPSQNEGIALAIYEAMAAGLPIVSADVGGQRELVSPECGMLIGPTGENTEVEKYAQALTRLLLDPHLRAEMGQAGSARVTAHYRIEQMGENMSNLLHEAIEFHERRENSILGMGFARTCATQAVEYARVLQLAERLWKTRNDTANNWNMLKFADWREKIYILLRWVYRPFYGWGIKHGGGWYIPIAEKVKQKLLGLR